MRRHVVGTSSTFWRVRVRRFLAVWTVDEIGHGVALAALMRQPGLQPAPDVEPSLPSHNRLVGAISRMSSRMHEVVEAVWSTAGAMNEHLAMAAYARMDSMLRVSGERALHETLFRRLRSHESAHKSFYAAYAAEVLGRMERWQRRLVRLVVQHTYMPVGAGGRRDRPAFARTVRALADDDWEPALVTPVQHVAERLLNEGREMDPSVRSAVLRCLATEAAWSSCRGRQAGRARRAASGPALRRGGRRRVMAPGDAAPARRGGGAVRGLGVGAEPVGRGSGRGRGVVAAITRR